MSEYLRVADFIGAGYKYLNDIRDSVASGQPDALGVLPGTAYGGGITQGAYLRLNDAEALALSDPAVGTLYGGVYRRVLFKAGITGGGNTGFRRGSIAFWDFPTANADPYQVTNVEATDPELLAGIVINASDTALAPLSGFYGWIQTCGTATVQYRGTVTSAGANLPVLWAKVGAGADNAFMDTQALATAVTFALLTQTIGMSIDASANAGTGRIIMNVANATEPRRI